ncbi:nitrate reductase molybdenum cofactor assembly chaperone [Gordonia sp. PP30]|uniref:nitrate reductase molybdenum cofactor assembly chaperone n=1 Tax=Gordonia sp. PP30 TaxID=2935861 RepID=UPI001FFF1E2A|nr:nitrate reductase molybdenum cofactor assembly chaperone [Gordonia sp. PP30]UQE74400.1 nitrate reductase molybdenum cofactor assembly chaperone [Gordonia sp. PP30]
MIYQVASLTLQYPDDELLSQTPLLAAALADLPDSPSTRALARFVEHLSASSRGDTTSSRDDTTGSRGDAAPTPDDLRRDYVDVFDLSRHQTLYLTYWSDGDTRRRGSALAAIKQTYRDSGFLVDTHGELTDYLPMILEFAARADLPAGRELLIEHRASLELIRLALLEKGSAYAGVLRAICDTLPGESPKDKATALSMRQSSPAVERVGLESGDPRLLPLFTAQDMAAMTRTSPRPDARVEARR